MNISNVLKSSICGALFLIIGLNTLSTDIYARTTNRRTYISKKSSSEKHIQTAFNVMRILIQGTINGASTAHNLFKIYAKPYIVTGARASYNFVSEMLRKLADIYATRNEQQADNESTPSRQEPEPYQYPEPSAPPIEEDEEYLFYSYN